jgi:hypothetical protein
MEKQNLIQWLNLQVLLADDLKAKYEKSFVENIAKGIDRKAEDDREQAAWFAAQAIAYRDVIDFINKKL